MTTTTEALHEPSAWLRGATARRLRQPDLAGLQALLDGDKEVFAYLVQPETSADRDAWETRCDRCKRQCQQGETFHTAAFQPQPGLTLMLGLCRTCADREKGVGQ